MPGLLKQSEAMSAARNIVAMRELVGEVHRRLDTETDTEQSTTLRATAEYLLGVMDYSNCRYPDAQAHYLNARDCYATIGDIRNVSRSNVGIGNVYWSTGHYPEALEAYQDALKKFESIGDKSGIARVIGNIGNVYNSTGDLDSALESYVRSWELFTELGDVPGRARIRGNIGLIHATHADYPLALDSFLTALQLHTEIGDTEGVARTSNNIGNVYRQLADYPKALRYLMDALETYESVGNTSGIARTLTNIGGVHNDSSEYELELDYYKRSIELFQNMGDEAGLARVRGLIGAVLGHLKRFDEAEKELEASIELTEALGMHTSRCSQIGSMATILEHTGRYAEALIVCEKQRVLADQIGLPSELLQATITSSKIYSKIGQSDRAQTQLHEALDISEKLGEVGTTARILLQLSEMEDTVGSHNALIYLRRHRELEHGLLGQQKQRQLAILEIERRISEERKLHAQYRTLLSQIMPESAVKRIVAGEEIIVDSYQECSVLFLDIVGFTGIAGSIPPQELISLLNDVFGLCDDIVEQHGLTKIKTIGDAYMAIAVGDESETKRLDHVVASANVAIHMMQALQQIPQLVTASSLPRARIGIHCGPVVAGVIGKKRSQFDVWGDAVNVASRMESTGETGKIHISDTFQQALAKSSNSTAYSMLERGAIEIKGKGSMNTFWLEGR